MDLQATRWDWIDLGQGRDKWRFLVNKVQNIHNIQEISWLDEQML